MGGPLRMGGAVRVGLTGRGWASGAGSGGSRAGGAEGAEKGGGGAAEFDGVGGRVCGVGEEVGECVEGEVAEGGLAEVVGRDPGLAEGVEGGQDGRSGGPVEEFGGGEAKAGEEVGDGEARGGEGVEDAGLRGGERG